ncbi:MAG: c-type cytochrome [Gammaproteobacteria bacterium]
MNSRYGTIGSVFLLSAFFASAQAADIGAGKSKSAACLGCHGSEGVSKSPVWPNLAGQKAGYIEAQLKNFKSEQRDNATMKAIAAGLSDADIQDLAAYFASVSGQSAGGDAAMAQTGKAKATMCMGCHGEDFQGNGQFPRLAGQHPQYLVKQLTDFRSGARKAGHMNAVAKTLSDEDINALAEYLGSL